MLKGGTNKALENKEGEFEGEIVVKQAKLENLNEQGKKIRQRSHTSSYQRKISRIMKMNL